MTKPTGNPLTVGTGTLTAAVHVGWTSTRPVRPDQHTTRVVVAVPVDPACPVDTGRAEQDARLAAAQIVAAHPGCVMPTSACVVAVTL